MTAITIRPEQPADKARIHTLTNDAFRDMPFSDGSEAGIVDALRAAGDLALSLVAENDVGIVGHIAFSPVTIDGDVRGWYGLGPVSVEPALQRQHIGTELITRGIADMRTQGARWHRPAGNPGFYGRFGFEHDPALRYPGPPAEYFQRLVIEGDAPNGIVSYAPAFSPKSA